MISLDNFIRVVRDTFPDSRLTYQKGLATFHPENVSEAAALIALAGGQRQKLYITGFGNNIDPLGPAFENLVVMRTDFLGQLIEVNESDLSVVVGAGFPLREINAKIESAGLFLPIGELPYVGSVGGAIAVGLSAHLNAKHWEHRADMSKESGENPAPQISIQRYILRLDVATPTGEVKSYGVSTATQPSGENFGRVFCQSWGLLGFIAGAKFRVAPLSAKDEYQDMREIEVSYKRFVEEYIDTNPEGGISDTDRAVKARYFEQLRQKFDPQRVFSIIGA
jgi:FAD/FMN-containing dehydrogenase